MEYTPGMISMKYDHTLDYPISMYDKLPYKRNYDYCNIRHVALYSGHIIKYYLCLNQSEKYPINNRDEQIEEILAAIRLQELDRMNSETMTGIDEPGTDGITQEQIQTLLDDPEPNTFPDDDGDGIDAPEGSVDAFEGVEDW